MYPGARDAQRQRGPTLATSRRLHRVKRTDRRIYERGMRLPASAALCRSTGATCRFPSCCACYPPTVLDARRPASASHAERTCRSWRMYSGRGGRGHAYEPLHRRIAAGSPSWSSPLSASPARAGFSPLNSPGRFGGRDFSSDGVGSPARRHMPCRRCSARRTLHQHEPRRLQVWTSRSAVIRAIASLCHRCRRKTKKAPGCCEAPRAEFDFGS